MNYRFYYILAALLLLPATASAQESDTLNTEDYKAERHVIESALGTMVNVIKSATLRDNNNSVQSKLTALAERLNAVNKSLPSKSFADAAKEADAAAPDPDDPKPTSVSDLKLLEQTLTDLSDEIRDLRRTLQAENEYELAEKLQPVEKGIDSAVVQTRRLIISETAPTIADADVEPEQGEARRESTDPWLKPGEYREGERVRGQRDNDGPEFMEDVRIAYNDAMDEVRADISEAEITVNRVRTENTTRTYHRYHRAEPPFDDFDYAEAYVGEFYNRWPYRETALYRPIPAIRYNRVEGLVLGARLLPLEWGDWDNAKLYGQVGYAFDLKDIRYEVGAEFRPFPYANDDFDFKLGVSYRDNTATNDIWKVNWVENTIASLLFEYDFMDYYNVEGFSAYAIQRLSPYAQLSVGYRSEDYASLQNNTSWSLFGSRNFRLNPFVSEAHLNSVVVALEGGQLSGLYSVPRGFAFRIDGEWGEGLGGDIDFSRIVGDTRFYIPFGYGSSLGFRFRGGYASDDAPIQKMFTLGGVGSMRAYAQNAYFGTRMLLANVEYTIANVSPLDDVFADIQLFGFADAGWVNTFGSNEVRGDDILPAAGFGVSFADRSLRLELAWPLKEVGGQKDPTLWLRITPTF